MKPILKANRIKEIISPSGGYTCLFDLENELCEIYRNSEKNLFFLKALQGQGVFLNDRFLLMFYNSSGYGYCEGDSYFYDLLSDSIIPFYYKSFNDLSNNIKWNGGYHISFSSNILVTTSFLIMKDEFGGVYFYKKYEILNKKKLDFFYNLPINNATRIEKIFNFDESRNVLEFSNYEGIIEHTRIDFNQSSLIAKSGISLRIYSDFYSGFALDYHTISSMLNQDGTFNTLRTKLGELLYQLKYQSNISVIKNIAEIASEFIQNEFHNVDIIIPVPPSNTARNFQPVIELSKAIGSITQTTVDVRYLVKFENTTPLKNVDDNETRKSILKNAFSLIDKRYKNKTILLLDDLYRSGETLNAVAKVLKEQGEVGDIYVLTITKTRTKK